MVSFRFAALVGAFIAAASVAAAAPLKLTPANPQPDAAALAQGLAVKYSFPPDVKSLRDARHWSKGAREGEPLIGFDYPDTEEGEETLTSDHSTRVVAVISGYLLMEEPGIYEIDFLSNDGLQVTLGGQEIAFFDGRHPCENAGVARVEAPVAGWYELSALYFQRLGTACLLAEWTPPSGTLDWIPNENTAYLK